MRGNHINRPVEQTTDLIISRRDLLRGAIAATSGYIALVSTGCTESTPAMTHDTEVQATAPPINEPTAPTSSLPPEIPKRTRKIPFSNRKYLESIGEIKSTGLYQIGANIQIMPDGTVPNSKGQHIIRRLMSDETGELSHRDITYDSTNTDARHNLHDWQKFFKNIKLDDDRDEGEIYKFYWTDFLFGIAYVTMPDGSLKAYDPTDQDQVKAGVQPFFIDEDIDRQLSEAYPDRDSYVVPESYYDLWDSLRLDYMKRVREGLDSHTAMALSAVLQAKRQEVYDSTMLLLGVYRDHTATTISELTDGMVSHKYLMKRLGSIPLEIYDAVSSMSQDPENTHTGFSGYYSAASPPEKAEYFAIDIGVNDDGTDFTSKMLRVMLHEIAGHAVAGRRPVNVMNGDEVLFPLMRQRGGALYFIEQNEDGTREYTWHYGTWFDEAMAELISELTIESFPGESQLRLDSGRLAEIALLLSLMMAPSTTVPRSIMEVTNAYEENRSNEDIINFQKAFATYYYANRSTDGPQDFNRANFPADDDSVLARKKLIELFDEKYGPGFFNRINLAMAKAEYLHDGDGDLGHAMGFSSSSRVVRAIVGALNYDTSNEKLPYLPDKSKMGVINLPWQHRQATAEKSAISSDAYDKYRRKWPATYKVLGAILAANGREELDDTLIEIMEAGDIDMSITL